MTDIIWSLKAAASHPDAGPGTRRVLIAEVLEAVAEIERLRAALVDCRVELDDYYMREYRSDDPIIQKRLEEKMASNPARVALEVK
jgi:hypothetical protein